MWFSLAAPSRAQIIGGAEQFLPQILLARLHDLTSDSLVLSAASWLISGGVLGSCRTVLHDVPE